jgi:hypothetical protein
MPRCFLEGKSLRELARGRVIPEDRTKHRLRAAALFYERQQAHTNLIVLGNQLNQARCGRPASPRYRIR